MVSTFKEETEETQKEEKARHAVVLVMQQKQMILLVSQQSKPCLIGETREREQETASEGWHPRFTLPADCRHLHTGMHLRVHTDPPSKQGHGGDLGFQYM